jgi:hypothetical protein
VLTSRAGLQCSTDPVFDGTMNAAAHLRRLETWAAGLWALSALVAVVAALAGWGLVLGIALLVLVVSDVLLYTGEDPQFPRWLDRHEMGAVDRALFREGVALLGWALATRPTPGTVVAAVTAVCVVHGAHVVYRAVTARFARMDRARLVWRGLQVDGRTEAPAALTQPVPSPPPLPEGSQVVLQLDILVIVGLWVSWASMSPVPVWVMLAGVVLGAGAVAWRVLARYRLIRSLPLPEEDNARLYEARVDHAPTVAVYFSGGRGTTYQLNVWIETIDRLTCPAVIFVRERHHLDELLPTSTPVVVLPRARDVEAFCVPSIRVVLYPTTVIKNNHMIRLPGLRHVFINHGDGDKSVTYSPLHRVFDEIWVAGQAGCDRYLNRGEGIRPDQLHRVGRPQLAHIERLADRPHTSGTVLYAPTWEGNFAGVDYRSVATMGERIIDVLTDPALGLTVLFKAHPATGTRLSQAAAARAAIEARLSAPGTPHRVVGTAPDALYSAFNEADVLVADISSVVADFLASRKPYLVTNPRDTDPAAFHADFPSTAAGALIRPDADGLAQAIRDALGEDRFREQREELATYFLGQPVGDPIAHFVEEVERAVERTPPRLSAAGEGAR